MGRHRRPDFTGHVVHLMNRAAGELTLFTTPEDYAAFERILIDLLAEVPLRVLAFCLMPNHWHIVAWPEHADEIRDLMHRLTLIHAARWRKHRGSLGRGHLYQGPYKANPVEPDDLHVLRTIKYVECNALTANLVRSAADWTAGSLWHRVHGDPHGLLSPGPIDLPAGWVEVVDEPQTAEELEALRRASRREAPYGSPGWVAKTAKELGLEGRVKGRGRPKSGRAPPEV